MMEDPTALLIILGVAAVIILFIILGVVSAKAERRRINELLAHAATQGWERTNDVTRMPPAVAEAARSGRSRLFLRHRYSPMWISWHRWTETSSSSSYNSSSGRWESSSSTTTHNLTRYFAALSGYFPDVSVERRTKIGAFLKHRRGVGTGWDVFDRMYVVKPTDDPAAVRVINPRLMQALTAGAAGPFKIAGSVVSLSDGSPIRREDLQRRTDELRRLIALINQDSSPY